MAESRRFETRRRTFTGRSDISAPLAWAILVPPSAGMKHPHHADPRHHGRAAVFGDQHQRLDRRAPVGRVMFGLQKPRGEVGWMSLGQDDFLSAAGKMLLYRSDSACNPTKRPAQNPPDCEVAHTARTQFALIRSLQIFWGFNRTADFA